MATTQPTGKDFADFVDNELSKAKPEDGRESIDNRERGCGHLKKNKAYIRTDTSALSHPDGEIPRFVTLDDPVEYREDLPLRGYGYFPGTDFSLTYVADGNTTTPPGDIHDHVDRQQRFGFKGDHYYDMPSARATDLIMSVGETYYPEPEDFVTEARERGLNKAIPMSANNDPPAIDPLRTRVWIIHPHGCGDGVPGIVGYSYVTRIVYTSGHDPGDAGSDPQVPGYVEDLADAGHVDIVDRGEPIEADDEDDDPEVTLTDFEPDKRNDDGTFDVDHKPTKTSVVRSDKPGRDVEEAPTDADTDAEGEDAQSDTDVDEDAHDERGALHDALDYNDAKAIAARKNLDVGRSPDFETLVDALHDAGATVADVGGDE